MLYAFLKSSNASAEKSEKELFVSIHKAYELYYYLLLLIIDVKDYALERIDVAREKKMPTHEDLHPNTRFVDNPLIQNIELNEQFMKFVKEKRLSWIGSPELIKNIYVKLINADFYSEYMNKTGDSFENDRDVIIQIYEQLINENELLYQILEEKSIYWNDDIEFMISMIIKNISKFGEQENYRMKLPEIYKNDDDVSFVKTLFRRTIDNHDDNIQMIDDFSKNWDLERIAFMDILLLEMAITEIKQISSIPVKVSFNEYIELAKFYSTSKSSSFVNGILDKIINHLKQENKIKKTGRGLIGSV